MTDIAIRAEGLVKRFGDQRALDGFDLSVAAGSVCGLLGPNGAGKTTAVRILTTLLHADGGLAEVAGIDVARDPDAVRHQIGFSGQQPAVDPILSGRQNLVLFGRLNGMPKSDAKKRATELLERFDLVEAADKSVKKYSGGMHRRLDLAVTLLQAPKVLFLDEPTTGLDPRSRNDVWDSIRQLVAGGTTVLLTTQYLEEADQLADQIVVMEAGRSIAHGAPEELKQQVGGDRIDVTLDDASRLDDAVRIIASIASGQPDVDAAAVLISAAVTDRADALTAVVRGLTDAHIGIADIGIRRPTLDDVFLRLTGHRAEVRETEEGEAA